MAKAQHPLTVWLARSPAWVFTLVASLAAFSTYFCMYAFRKPFAAGAFEGTFPLFGATIQLKAALIISQTIGYALSKYLGIKICSEAAPSRRAVTLVGLILAAEAALLLFGIVPPNWKVLAIFLNGLPLGMIWGLVVWYLEGRRTSEILLVALSCSFIVSSGVVRSIGQWLMMDCSVAETWMPATTGALFLPLLFLSVWVLSCLPKATSADITARVARQPMNGRERLAFLWHFFTGMTLLCLVYFFLTAYRDFRDFYGSDVLKILGYGDQPQLLGIIEIKVGLAVAMAMAPLYLILDNRRALLCAFLVMIAGTVLMGGATLLFDRQQISGKTWMILVGLGAYLAYVPYNTLLFERMMASARSVGTAVFAIAVADSFGYTGTVVVNFCKEFAFKTMDRLEFLHGFTYFMSLLGTVSLIASCWYFIVRVPRSTAAREQLDAAALTEKSYQEAVP